MKKKYKEYVALGLALLFVAFLFVFSYKHEAENRYVHQTFRGTILSYEDSDDCIVLTIDDDYSNSPRSFIINEDTMYTDDLIRQQVISKTVGIRIIIESEFWTLDDHETYPAILVSPATDL